MSRSSRHREKYANSSEIFQDESNEGTAARTRPLSFDEIMLRRSNKKLIEDVKEVSGGAVTISGKEIIEKASDHIASDRGHKLHASVPSGMKHDSDDFRKPSSWKKDDNASIKGDNLGKTKDKENRDYVIKLKSVVHKDTVDKTERENIDRRTVDKTERENIDRRGHGRRKHDHYSSEDSGNEMGKRYSRDLTVKDRYSDRSRGKSDKNDKRRHQKEDDEEKDSKRRHRNEDDEERESKRRHRNEDDERSRAKNVGKKHDAEFTERKEKKESSHLRHEQLKAKRRRSRSKDRDKDKGRRSLSLSPRMQKHTAYDVREQEELSSHSTKDRSGRQHSDVDRKRISNNGSSSHHRRHSESASGLGGYSPRKRKTEAAVRTPSPTTRSPEKKGAGWDLPHTKRGSNVNSSVISNLQISNQTLSSVSHELPSAVPIASTVKLPFGGFPFTPTNVKAPIDSVQLTEASRPMRRLYVENIPASASEKAIIECLNNFLLSSGVNHIHGIQPCISCILNKEKHQALVEFLAPEYASAALSFDGRSLYDSILKIRRPKDFVEVTSGVVEKSVAAVNSISDIVKDSPHKIFVGGISKVISSEMLMKIVSAFGPLKAYRFEVKSDLNETCAFLEYVDQSIALKACAGLNGMKLGGQELTAVQATPNEPSMEFSDDPPLYWIPEHAKPLLEKPTQVLKLKNVLDPDNLSSLPESDMEEILEDIRLECSRFGTVKSVNVVKPTNPETSEAANNLGSAVEGQDLEADDIDIEANPVTEAMNHYSEKTDRSEPSISAAGSGGIDEPPEDKSISAEICEPIPVDGDTETKDINSPESSNIIFKEIPNQSNPLTGNTACDRNDDVDVIQIGNLDIEDIRSEGTNGNLETAIGILKHNEKTESDAVEIDENTEQISDHGDVFEPGCVLVEFRRTEASSMAAHCLHGRIFDNRIVSCSYVANDLYQARFPK